MLSCFFTFNIFPKRFRIIIIMAFLDNRIYMVSFSVPKLFFTLALKISISVPFATPFSLSVKSGFSLKAPFQFWLTQDKMYLFLHILMVHFFHRFVYFTFEYVPEVFYVSITLNLLRDLIG